jgi:outer membrane protein TolC
MLIWNIKGFVPYGAALIFLLSILSAPCALAEDSVTLVEAVRAAMKDNPAIKAKMWAFEAARKDVDISKSPLWPGFYAEERLMRTDNPTYYFMSKLDQRRFEAADFAIDKLNNPNPINNYLTEFGFEMPLYARKIYVGMDMAKVQSEVSSLEFFRLRERVALEVFEAFAGVRTAEGFLSAARTGMMEAGEILRVAQAMEAAGTGLYSDVLRARAAEAGARRKVIVAEKTLKVAKRALGLAMGRTGPWGAAGDYVEPAPEDYEVYRLAALGRSDIRACEKGGENAQNALKMARSAYYPAVGVGGAYQLNDHERPAGAEGSSWRVSAFVRMDLFDGFKREDESARAEFKIKEAAELLEGQRRRAEFEVFSAYAAVGEARQMRTLAVETLAAAQEGLRLVEKRYAASLAPFVSVLDARALVDGARAEFAASAGRYITAMAELEFASGRILKLLDLE